MREFTIEHYRPALDRYHKVSGLPSCPVEVPHQRAEISDRGAQATKIDALREEKVGERKSPRDEREAPDESRWGTPAARMREMMRLQRRIDELRKQKKDN